MKILKRYEKMAAWRITKCLQAPPVARKQTPNAKAGCADCIFIGVLCCYQHLQPLAWISYDFSLPNGRADTFIKEDDRPCVAEKWVNRPGCCEQDKFCAVSFNNPVPTFVWSFEELNFAEWQKLGRISSAPMSNRSNAFRSALLHQLLSALTPRATAVPKSREWIMMNNASPPQAISRALGMRLSLQGYNCIDINRTCLHHLCHRCSMSVHVNARSACKIFTRTAQRHELFDPSAYKWPAVGWIRPKTWVRKWPFPAGNSGPLQATDPCARKTAVSACLPVECCLWDGSAALSNRLETILFFPQQQSFAMGSLARSGAIRCSFNTRFRTRFRKFPVQVLGEVPEGSGEDTCWGSEGFCAVPEGSGADTLWGSRGFRCRYLVRFRKFPVQVLGEVPEGCGDTWLGSRGFCCR